MTVGEARSLDSAIVKTQAFPPKKGDSEEVCLYYDALKLFAVRSKGGTIGFRVRDPVTEADAKYATVKSLAAQAASRLK